MWRTEKIILTSIKLNKLPHIFIQANIYDSRIYTEERMVFSESVLIGMTNMVANKKNKYINK